MVLNLVHVHNFNYLTVASTKGIFGLDNSSYVYLHDKNKNILVSDEDSTQV